VHNSIAVGVSLPALGITLLGWGLLFATAAVITQRRLGAPWAYWGWAVTTTLIAGLAAIAFDHSFPNSEGRIAGTLFTFAALAGIPAGAAVLAAVQTARLNPEQTWLRQIAWSFLAFVASLPVALVLAIMPDLLRFFQR
jgi:hypothetical protein